MDGHAKILPIISQIIQSNRNDFDESLQTIIRLQPAAGILTDDLKSKLQLKKKNKLIDL